MVACLHKRGYLFRDAGGAYRVSSKLFRMGQTCPPFQDILTRSRIPMRRFAQTSGEAVHISVLAEDRLLILANVPGPGYLQLGINAGTPHDPILSASGRVFLASMPPAEYEAFIKRNSIRPDRVKTLNPRLARISRNGYECVESHLYCGVYDLALAVKSRDGECVAAVACSYLRPRHYSAAGRTRAAQTLLPKLRHCARQIAAAFDAAPSGQEEALS